MNLNYQKTKQDFYKPSQFLSLYVVYLPPTPSIVQ